jgi:RNA polymerase sigma-70 factor (sigma-E family)
MTPAERADFEEFVAARYPALLRTARLLTGDWQLAEDLVQTALARTSLRWSRLRSVEGAEPYVRRVLVTTYATWWRRRWRGETPTAELPDRAGPDPYGAVDHRDRVERAVATLPRRQRAVVVLRYYDDLPESQVAQLLGCSVGTVRSQASRALAKLRIELDDDRAARAAAQEV